MKEPTEAEALEQEHLAHEVPPELQEGELNRVLYENLKTALKKDAQKHIDAGTMQLPVDPEEFASRLSGGLLGALALPHEKCVRAITEVCDELGVERIHVYARLHGGHYHRNRECYMLQGRDFERLGYAEIQFSEVKKRGLIPCACAE